VHIRGVLYGAIFLMAAAGCAGQEASPSAGAAPRSPPAWTEPAGYKFSFASSCGEQALIGRFRATVSGGTVTETEGLDEAGKRALMLRIADLVPSLGQMVADAEQARADGADVAIERDPADGHPTAIRVDPDPNGVDDETCYTISDYTIGGQPGPSVTPSR
jgi:Family of unknown function (DUF6174)